MTQLKQQGKSGRAFVIASVLASMGVASATPALANVVYQTNTPFGGPFGLIGFDVSSEQSVALRFTPYTNFTLDRVSVWFMNNDFKGGHPPLTITLRTDNAAAGSIPSEVILETWQLNVSAVGWAPMLEELDSREHPELLVGVNYWVVGESTAPGGNDPVWNWAAMDSGFMSICNGAPCEWTPANTGAVAAGIIEGTPTVLGDIDGNGEVDVDDLLAVISGWGPCPDLPAVCPADIAPAGAPDGVINVDDLLLAITNWG